MTLKACSHMQAHNIIIIIIIINTVGLQYSTRSSIETIVGKSESTHPNLSSVIRNDDLPATFSQFTRKPGLT